MADIKTKDPAARKPYQWNWNTRYPDDTIATSTFTPSDPTITITASNDDTTATAWIAGGLPGVDYRITNHITTASGVTDEWTLILKVRNQ